GKKEKRHAFEISQGSAFECVPMLTILHRKKKIKEEEFKELYDECYIISKMLSGLITHFKEQQATNYKLQTSSFSSD
ncbi:MAG: four helix bundle protein, partial [Candidatus Omnitrophota bacterium]